MAGGAVKVFLDDVRPAPEGWVRAYTPEEVIALLHTGRVEELSLDYDLGFHGEEERRTGEAVLQWIEERVFRGETDFELPAISIHSSNPVGLQRLRRALDAIHRRLREPPAAAPHEPLLTTNRLPAHDLAVVASMASHGAGYARSFA